MSTELKLSENANFDFDDKVCSQLYAGKKNKAYKLIKQPDKVEKFLRKLEDKLQGISLFGTSLSYVSTFISMVRSYFKKEYREIPINTIVMLLSVLIYVFTPVDLVPDVIPVLGFADDVALVGWCVKKVTKDLDDYRRWKDTMVSGE